MAQLEAETVSNIIFCPECGNVAYYNPYFGKNNCTVCKYLWEVERTPREQFEHDLDVSLSTTQALLSLYDRVKALEDRLITEVCVEITDHCPLSCIHCSSDAGPRKGNFMTLEQYKAILRQYPNATISLSGGEPLRHPKIKQFLALKPVRVYTSGYPEVDPELLRGHKAIVSIYGGRQTHDEITQVKGSWKRAVSWILQGADIHCVPMRNNETDLGIVCDLAVQAGVMVSFLRLVSHGRATAEMHPDYSTLIPRLQAMQKDSALIRLIRLGGPWTGKCNLGKKRLITWNGTEYPCESVKGGGRCISASR